MFRACRCQARARRACFLSLWPCCCCSALMAPGEGAWERLIDRPRASASNDRLLGYVTPLRAKRACNGAACAESRAPACLCGAPASLRLRGAPGYAALAVRQPAPDCAVRLPWWVTCLRGVPAWLRCTPACVVRLTARCAYPSGSPVCAVRLAAPSCAARLPVRVHLPWWVACVCGAPALVDRLRGEPVCAVHVSARCACLATR